MRRLVGWSVAIAFGVVVMIVCAWVMALAVAKPPEQASGATCTPSSAVAVTDSKGGQTIPMNGDRQKFVEQVIAIGKKRKLPARAWQVAIQAASAESTLQDLTYGDRDSLGWFQMRPSMGWGTPAQLHDTVYQINTWYDHLEKVSGWESMQPGDAAQAVEGSGFPDRYNLFEGFASQLVKKNAHVKAATGGGDPSGCSGQSNVPASKIAKVVIAAEKKYLGTPYAWGGGTPDGPSGGMPPDVGVKGFDCSSLQQYGYAKAGINLPRQSGQQYGAGKHIPFSQAKPGDLVFWAAGRNPQAIHHVALYLGGGKVLQAPQSGDVIKISPVWDGGERLPDVTRPGGAESSMTKASAKGKHK